VLKLNKSELISYILSCISFILKDIEGLVHQIILFGSIARGTFDKNSDIDIFFDVDKENIKKVDNLIKKGIIKFYKSRLYETWKLKGINNSFSTKVGVLDTWKLKRSILSDGIILYGRYKEFPKETKHYILIIHKPIKDITKRNKIIRKIIGRYEKNYQKKGIMEDIKGKLISPRVILIPVENFKYISEILNKEKIDYKFFEVWSDQFN
jgi:predicted nucleotidyltransferase